MPASSMGEVQRMIGELDDQLAEPMLTNRHQLATRLYTDQLTMDSALDQPELATYPHHH